MNSWLPPETGSHFTCQELCQEPTVVLHLMIQNHIKIISKSTQFFVATSFQVAGSRRGFSDASIEAARKVCQRGLRVRWEDGGSAKVKREFWIKQKVWADDFFDKKKHLNF